MVFTLILYIFMFLYAFISNNVAMIANQNILQTISVTAGGSTYNVTTTNYYALQNRYGSLPQTVTSLQNLGCLIDGYQGEPIYSSTAYNNSTTWIVFLICSLVSMRNHAYMQSSSSFSRGFRSTTSMRYEHSATGKTERGNST